MTPKSPGSRLLQRALLLTFGLCLSFGLTEVLVRFWKGDIAFQPDPDLIRSLRSHVTRKIYAYDTPEVLQSVPQELPGAPSYLGMDYTNNVGLRMKDDLGPKGPGEKRILFLGDSYTEAEGVPDEQRFYSLVQQSLDSRKSDGEHWSVINAGIQNGTPSQYILQLRRYISRFHPDIVLVFLGANDVADDFGFEDRLGFEFDSRGIPLRPSAWFRLSLLQKSWTLRYLDVVAQRWHWWNENFGGAGRLKSEHPPNWRSFLCNGDPGTKEWFLRKTGRYIVELKEMSETGNARLGVFLIHYMWIFDHEPFYEKRFPDLGKNLEASGCLSSKGRPYREFIASFLKKQGIRYSDPYGAMLEEKVKNPERKLWNFYDYHFSPAGHRVVAREVVRFLEENFLKS